MHLVPNVVHINSTTLILLLISLLTHEKLFFSRNDPGRGLTDGDRMILTGWGRITNNRGQATAALSRFKVSTRTLRRLTVPMANNKCTSRDAFNINTEKQMCAGGQKGKISMTSLLKLEGA